MMNVNPPSYLTWLTFQKEMSYNNDKRGETEGERWVFFSSFFFFLSLL